MHWDPMAEKTIGSGNGISKTGTSTMGFVHWEAKN